MCSGEELGVLSLPPDDAFYTITHTRQLLAPDVATQACYNTLEAMKQVGLKCQAESGRRVNAMAVNFMSSGKGAIDVAAALNGVKHVGSPYSDSIVCKGCLDDSHCDAGDFCLLGLCVGKFAAPAPCTGDNQCQNGLCFGLHCAQCADSSQCVSSQFCLAGECVTKGGVGTPCESAVGCKSDLCINNLCSECTTSADCGPDDFCVTPECLPKWFNGLPCTDPIQCASGICHMMVCAECDDHADCDSGERVQAI